MARVYVVSGFLFNNKTIRAWAKARNVDLPRSDAMLSMGLGEWFEEKDWNAFWPMVLTWPRDSATLKDSANRKPYVLLVCHEKKVSKKILKLNPNFEIEMDDRDRQVETWLRRQGLTRTRWVTIPDPWQDQPGSTRGEGDECFDYPEWEDVDGWRDRENSQSEAAGSSKASRHVTSNRARPSSNASQSPTSEGSPPESSGSGHILRSGKIIPANRGDITSPTHKAHQKSERSLRPRREPRGRANKIAN